PVQAPMAPIDRAGTDPTWVRQTPQKAISAQQVRAQQHAHAQQISATDVQPDAATIQLEVPPHILMKQREALQARTRGGGGAGWRWAFATLLLACVAGGA